MSPKPKWILALVNILLFSKSLIKEEIRGRLILFLSNNNEN